MNIKEILRKIETDNHCVLIPQTSKPKFDIELPTDLKYFYEHFESLSLFTDKPFGIKIPSLNQFVKIKKKYTLKMT